MELKRFFAPLRMTAEEYPLFLSTPEYDSILEKRLILLYDKLYCSM